MGDAADAKSFGVCMTAWELYYGTLMDNHWEHTAAAVADGNSVERFARRFFGSERADYRRLEKFYDERFLARLHPVLLTPTLRRQFGKTESAYLFYHMFGHGKTRQALRKLAQRAPAARRVIRDIRRRATRRKFYLEFLDLPLDLIDVMSERIETLAAVRETSDKLHPHRLGATAGTRMLQRTVRKLDRHVQQCKHLADRYDHLADTRGGSRLDAYRLRRQIGELLTLRGYVKYHVTTYAAGG